MVVVSLLAAGIKLGMRTKIKLGGIPTAAIWIVPQA
jgi:hypothetical protein